MHDCVAETQTKTIIDGVDIVGFTIFSAFANTLIGVIIRAFTGMYCSFVQGVRWPEGQADAYRRACFKAFAGAQLLNQTVLLAVTIGIFAVAARKPGFLPYGWVALALVILPRLVLAADALRCQRTLDRMPWRFNTAFVASDDEQLPG